MIRPIFRMVIVFFIVLMGVLSYLFSKNVTDIILIDILLCLGLGVCELIGISELMREFMFYYKCRNKLYYKLTQSEEPVPNLD